MEVLSPQRVGVSAAAVAGILYVACTVLFAVAPVATLRAFQSMFHGVDISQIARASVPLGSTVWGLVLVVVSGFVAGWLFARVYNAVKG